MVNRKAVTSQLSFKPNIPHFAAFVCGVQLPGNDCAGLHVEDWGRNLHSNGDWDNLVGLAAAKIKTKQKSKERSKML